MRIAFILTMGDAPWGGSEVLWSKTAALALEQGHSVFIAGYRWPTLQPQLRELQQQGAILFFRPSYKADLKSRVIARVKQLTKRTSEEVQAIRSFQPDLVIVNQGGAHDIIYRADLLDFLLAKQYPYCLICHLYQDPVKLTEEERTKIVRVFSGAKRIFAISNNQAAVMQRQLAIKLPNLTVVQNPINIPAHWPVTYPSTSIPQFAVVASLDVDRKGQDVLLEVLARPSWQARSWHLNLYGKGPDQSYLSRLAEYYSIVDRVTFHGHVADSGQIWQNNHLLIIPSRIESGPMVLTEAMLSGRTVVATNVGMVREWLEDGVTGFIAEAALPDSLDHALERTWLRKEEWEQLGQQAYSWAKPRIDLTAEQTMLQVLTHSM